jgi:hypothetical protein
MTKSMKSSQALFANMNSGTGGSLARVRCSWSRRETMEMNEAMEKTEMEADVSLRMLILRWVRW